MKQQSTLARECHQYEFDWAGQPSAGVSLAPSRPALVACGGDNPSAVTRHVDDMNSAIHDAEPNGPAITVPWDFRNSFPCPLPGAIEAGLLAPEDEDPDAVKALHDEHAAECLSLLNDLDSIEMARQGGTDPRTRKRPRSDKARQRVLRYLETAPAALLGKFDDLMNVYDTAFGPDAAQAFRAVLHAWHRGVPVVVAAESDPEPVTIAAPAKLAPEKANRSERVIALGAPVLPIPIPLDNAISQGAFGHDEDGDAITPSSEEVEAITLHHADRMMDLLDTLAEADAALAHASEERRLPLYQAKDRAISAYQSALQLYAEDFGEEAARHLDAWVHHHMETNRGATEYEPGHPWHYLAQGDSRSPVPVDEISPGPVDAATAAAKLPKDRATREKKLRALRAHQKSRLAADRQRYTQLVDLGAAALSDFDRNIAYAGDEELAWASAVALAYTSIRSGLGRLAWIEHQIASLLGTGEAVSPKPS